MMDVGADPPSEPDRFDERSEERRSRLWYLWMAALPVAALIIGWIIISHDDRGIDGARRQWKAAAMDDYVLTYRVLPDDALAVTVRAGEVAEVDPADAEGVAWTVDDLFDRIEVARDSDALDGVVWHPDDGYPLAFDTGDVVVTDIAVRPVP